MQHLSSTDHGTTSVEYENHPNFSYVITGQALAHGKTVFIICHRDDGLEFLKSANELYRSPNLLSHFSPMDLVNIVSTAVQEQTMDDLYFLYSA